MLCKDLHNKGNLESDGDDFFFKYGVGQLEDKTDWFSMEYTHKDMCWKMKSKCSDDGKGNAPFVIDGTAQVLAPGYVPVSCYEVPLEFHKNGPEGEIVGEGFGEAMSLIAFAENSPITSLPNQPDQAYTQPGW